MNALGRHTESTLNIRAYTAHIQVGLPYAALAAQLGDNCTAATLAVVLARRVKMLQPRHGVAVALAGYSAGAVVATAVAAALEAEGEVVTVACREALFCRPHWPPRTTGLRCLPCWAQLQLGADTLWRSTHSGERAGATRPS